MINKRILLLGLIILSNFTYIGTSAGKCLPSADASSPCRYEAGDSWCLENGGGNRFAYSDECLSRQNASRVPVEGRKELTEDPKFAFGTPEEITYGQFYAMSIAGMQPLHPYTFTACLSQTPCLNSNDSSKSQVICGLDLDQMRHHKPTEFIKWLESGETFCGSITAMMNLKAKISLIALRK